MSSRFSHFQKNKILVTVLHRRRNVLNIRGKGAKVQTIGEAKGGGEQTFRWLKTDWSPRPQSVSNNYISHIEK